MEKIEYCECEVIQEPTPTQDQRPQPIENTTIHIDLTPIFWIFFILIITSFIKYVIKINAKKQKAALGAARKKKSPKNSRNSNTNRSRSRSNKVLSEKIIDYLFD
jgi:hypothetical protein